MSATINSCKATSMVRKLTLISRRALLAGSAGLMGAAAVVSGIVRARRTRRPVTFAIQAPIRQDWLDKRHEEIIEPGLPIVDPHHHLWDRPGYRYLFQDLLADTGSGHNIRATLFEECGAMYRTGGPPELRSLGETEFANGVARMSASGKYGPTRCCSGIIGHVDLRIGFRAKAVLEEHLAVSDGRLRGIRNSSAWPGDPSLKIYSPAPQSLLVDKSFREGFACVGAHLRRLDVPNPAQRPRRSARAFPHTTIVLNHVGGPLAIGP